MASPEPTPTETVQQRLERLADEECCKAFGGTVHRLLPCPSGCGCVTEEDPDRRDCACDGPCCFAEQWPILGPAEPPRA
jgi:hypothetical protein